MKLSDIDELVNLRSQYDWLQSNLLRLEPSAHWNSITVTINGRSTAKHEVPANMLPRCKVILHEGLTKYLEEVTTKLTLLGVELK